MSTLGVIGKFLSGGVVDILGPVRDIIDDSTLSPEEKAELKLKWAEAAMANNSKWSPHAIMAIGVLGSTLYSMHIIEIGAGAWTDITMAIRLLLLSAFVGLEIGKVKQVAKDVGEVVRGPVR